MSRQAPRRAAHGEFALPKGVRIVHEDDDLIVIDKPTGLVTADPRPVQGHRVAGTTRSLFDALKQYFRSPGKRGSGRPRAEEARGAPPPPVWVIHRLDKEASGLVVFAKSQRAFNWLKEDFRSKRVKRRYLALAEGEVGAPGSEGTCQSLMRDEEAGESHHRKPRGSVLCAPAGWTRQLRRHALSRARNGIWSHMPSRLETGRKNQIRIHFAEKGTRWSATALRAPPPTPSAAWACTPRNWAAHPATGQEIVFASPRPRRSTRPWA